ncbi:hypothetical protein DEO72_LG4g746 [Vigna unguiculata]|uniref:Uncharacterized protein n=1 Tax=Vigna unguiculata TaxID=3917 RepID=A0A4D6LMJ4_VIGUN|nr:hypothetical protein DEO72_LG4g746 [Vigna unguiculata]
MKVHKIEVQHQRRRRHDGGRRMMVAATEEGGGSDGGRERDKRVTRGAAKRGFAFVFTFAWCKVNRGIKLGWNCKNATAPLYASVLGELRHIRNFGTSDNDAVAGSRSRSRHMSFTWPPCI